MGPPIESKFTISFKSDRGEGKILWNVSDIDSDIGITNIPRSYGTERLRFSGKSLGTTTSLVV